MAVGALEGATEVSKMDPRLSLCLAIHLASVGTSHELFPMLRTGIVKRNKMWALKKLRASKEEQTKANRGVLLSTNVVDKGSI